MIAKTKIIYNRDGSVKKIVSNVGQTHHNRAAYELHCNNIRPTFGLKLRRFFKALASYREKKKYKARRENRQCVKCGSKLPDGYYYVQCQKCRDFLKEYRKRKRLENVR